MISDKTVHEIQCGKGYLTAEFIRSFDREWKKVVREIKGDSGRKEKRGKRG